MSALVLEDYCKPMFKERISERASGFIMRGTVVILGLLSVCLVYVVEHMGSVLQLSMSVPATCYGSFFGILIIGLFLPWIGKQATFFGALTAAIFLIYIVVQAQLDMASGLIIYDTKITSVEGCDYNFTKSDLPVAVESDRKMFNISYLYYMPLGASITCLLAFISSFWFGFEDPSKVDPRLLAPFMRKYFRKGIISTTNGKKVEEEEDVDELQRLSKDNEI